MGVTVAGFVGHFSYLLLLLVTFCLLMMMILMSTTNTVHSDETDICRSVARVMFRGVYTVLLFSLQHVAISMRRLHVQGGQKTAPFLRLRRRLAAESILFSGCTCGRV